MSKLEIQCWICSYCHDDHSSSTNCTDINYLKSRIDGYKMDIESMIKESRALLEKLKMAEEALEFLESEDWYWKEPAISIRKFARERLQKLREK